MRVISLSRVTNLLYGCAFAGLGRAECELLEDLLLQRAIRIQREEVSVFAVSVNDTVSINGHRIHTPFEAVRVIIHALLTTQVAV